MDLSENIQYYVDQISSLNRLLDELQNLPNTALIAIQKRFVRVLISRAENKLRDLRTTVHNI